MTILKVLTLVAVVLSGIFVVSAEDATALKTIKNGIQHFTSNIFKLLYKTGENLVCSPFNVYLAVAEVALGSKGETLNQAKDLLGASGVNDSQKIHCSIKCIQETIEKTSGLNKIIITNAIFIQTPLKLKREFDKAVKKYYKSIVEDVDFENNGTAAKNIINQNINSNTEGLIPNLLKQPLPAETKLALVETLYFKANWSVQFNEEKTEDDEFHVGNETIPIKMMCNSDEVPYIKSCSLQAEIIRLDYFGNEASIFFLLPFESSSLSELIRNLSADSIQKIIAQTNSETAKPYITYKVPRLKNEWNSEIKPQLQSLNLTKVFSDKAEIDMIQGQQLGQLKVDQVNHAAVIKLDEYGTEAAAVTVVTLIPTAIREEPKLTYSLNRPFLYFIYHNIAEVILFIGTVFNPNGN